jgi:hypothetical protein
MTGCRTLTMKTERCNSVAGIVPRTDSVLISHLHFSQTRFSTFEVVTHRQYPDHLLRNVSTKASSPVWHLEARDSVKIGCGIYTLPTDLSPPSYSFFVTS